MVKKNINIRDQFTEFNFLLSELKLIVDNPIHLENKKNNPYWLLGDSLVTSENIKKDIIFIVEKSKRDNKYGIKLRCPELTGEPFFRFDSDGPAHRNDNPEIPLEDQLITTPHFNTYSDDGTSIAYKNDVLKDNVKADIIVNDVNFGISMFCMETQCQLKNGNFPNVIEAVMELGFDIKPSTNFDDIDFI